MRRHRLFLVSMILSKSFEGFCGTESRLFVCHVFLEIKYSARGFGLEFSYVFTRKSSCGCSVGASARLGPSVLEFSSVFACKCGEGHRQSAYSRTGTISVASCRPNSFQQSCHMQVGGSLSITQIAEWEAYQEVHPNHLICLCSVASLLATEDFFCGEQQLNAGL